MPVDPDPVILLPYNPEWPRMFERERARLEPLIREYIFSFEHVGSTSVPDLAAKPVIDILIGVKTLADDKYFVPLMVSAGYVYIQVYEEQLPERRYLKKQVKGRHTHHLHMAETTSAFYRDHLLFRDYLRTHPETAKEYETLKRQLAIKFKHDREAYTDSKADFIQGVLQKARLTK
jgi:GrpB-like predicted nucleotidyltransferase (UPF0157 family)